MKKHTIRNTVIVLLCLLFIAAVVWIIWGNTALSVTEYVIQNNSIPQSFSGLRIVQISDLHNAEFGEGNESLLEMIRSVEPDIILITGDIVDSRRTDCQIALHFAEEAVKIAPTYYVPGNHESRIEEYEQLEKDLISAGVTVLINDTCFLERNGETIQLLGLEDPDFRSPDDTVTSAQILDEISDSETYKILLSHRPEQFKTYVSCEIDLAFTGHVHGGQFRLPFIGGIYGPGQGFFPEYDAGLYTENKTNMIVSRGLGNSLFPFRINNRPEIVIVDLISE